MHHQPQPSAECEATTPTGDSMELWTAPLRKRSITKPCVERLTGSVDSIEHNGSARRPDPDNLGRPQNLLPRMGGLGHRPDPATDGGRSAGH